jgi:colicin import membrane protein
MAKNSKLHIDAVTGERIDLEKQRQDAEAAKAEQERQAAIERDKADKAAVEQDKKEWAAAKVEAAKRKRLVAEQKKKQDEADLRDAKTKAEEDAKAAEKQRKVRAACTEIYKNTIDKNVKDLTVREEQQVAACQLVGLYPPQ